jgi:DNA-binding protein YbaB
MPREIDEAYVEEAIGQYRRIQALRDEYAKAAAELEVTVRSPNGLVEIVVTGAGEFRDVVITKPDQDAGELAKAMLAACQAVSSAREWARHKLYEEHFRDYQPLLPGRPEESW